MKGVNVLRGGDWLYVNPIYGLSVRAAQGIYDAARMGSGALLHRIYDAIEAADPILMTCVERRAAALAGLGWRVKALAEGDKVLAQEQYAAVREFIEGIENLTEAVEHLDLAFFRGFSFVQPLWEGGSVRKVELLNSWNFLRGRDGSWFWNPECRDSTDGLMELTYEHGLVSIERRRAIDYPAMQIYIRHALGERDWGRFVERYGIPPVDAVMAPGATMDQRADYLEAAEAARDGRSVVWPSGSTVGRAEGSRGVEPFTAFCEHLEKQIVLMATGGTLTSLAQADTGALAGGAQMDVWEQIVRRDSAVVGDALHRDLIVPFLRSAFPGRPRVVSFELGREAEQTASEIFDTAARARSAGYVIDQAELENETGMKLVREENVAPMTGGSFVQNAQNAVADPLQISRRGDGDVVIPQTAEERLTGLLDDFAIRFAEELEVDMVRGIAGEDVDED